MADDRSLVKDYTQGPIVSALLLFALPTLASNILQSLNASINTVWVGQFLGPIALAATTNASIIMFLLFATVFGFGMAATVMVAQAFGRHDIDAARQAFGSAVGFCVVLSAIIAIAGWFSAGQILIWLDTPTEAFDMALLYLRIIFFAMPSTMITVIIMMSLRGAGDAMTPLWFMGLNVIIDVILNPILILGLWFFPEMGIAGSATATLIAGYVSLFGLLITLYIRNLPIRLRGREWMYLLPRMTLLKSIVGKGVPMGLQILIMATAGLVMVSLVNQEGLLTVAAYGAMQQLWTYLQMPAMAIGAAVSAMVAQNIGANQWSRVGRITMTGLVTTFVLVGVMIAVLIIFDHPLMALFLDDNMEAIGIARHMQWLASWSFLFFGLTMVIISTMRANGAVLVPLAILFIALYPVRLIFYHFAYPSLQADAIWLSFPLGALVSLVLVWIYYIYGNWRKARMPVHPVVPPMKPPMP